MVSEDSTTVPARRVGERADGGTYGFVVTASALPRSANHWIT